MKNDMYDLHNSRSTIIIIKRQPYTLGNPGLVYFCVNNLIPFKNRSHYHVQLGVDCQDSPMIVG